MIPTAEPTSEHDADLARIARYSVGHGTDPGVLPGETVVLLPQPAQGEIAPSSDIRLREARNVGPGPGPIDS